MSFGAILSGVAGGLANVGSAWASFKGVKENQRVNDLNFQLQKENLAYQKDLQNIIFGREDNAVQRRVADLRKAGLSPTLAAGSAAGAGSVISTSAPQKLSDLQGYLALAQVGTMLANQQKAQTEADIARQNLKQIKMDNKYLKDRGLAPMEVNQDWQHRLINLLYPKLEDLVFGDKDKGKEGLFDKVIGSFTNRGSVDTSNYKTFDKDIPRVKLANGDTLNDYEYEIMKKKDLLRIFYTTGWTKYLEQMVYGD